MKKVRAAATSPATRKNERKKRSGVSATVVRKIALSFPEAHEKPSYGKPAFFVGKKFFARHRSTDDSLVLIVGDIAQRDMMLELDPDTYFITDHYRDYPSVLVRLSRITEDELRTMLERRWRAIAPKKLIKEIEAKAGSTTVKKR